MTIGENAEEELVLSNTDLVFANRRGENDHCTAISAAQACISPPLLV